MSWGPDPPSTVSYYSGVSITICYSCWLSTEKGTIFAFVAPMIAIIIVSQNIERLCLCLN